MGGLTDLNVSVSCSNSWDSTRHGGGSVADLIVSESIVRFGTWHRCSIVIVHEIQRRSPISLIQTGLKFSVYYFVSRTIAVYGLLFYLLIVIGPLFRFSELGAGVLVF